jgi:hypothetical protein
MCRDKKFNTVSVLKGIVVKGKRRAAIYIYIYIQGHVYSSSVVMNVNVEVPTNGPKRGEQHPNGDRATLDGSQTGNTRQLKRN